MELVRVARLLTGRVKKLVTKSPSEISVELETEDESVGYIIVSPEVSGRFLLNDKCERNVEKLVKSEFGGKKPKVYYVMQVLVEKEFQGQGYGTMLYEQALKAMKPAILISGGCTGMGTTAGAFRVWKSLKKRHKVLGKGPNEMAVAAK